MWDQILEELKSLRPNALTGINPLTMDALHGSMWGLNHRYTTVESCLQNDWQRMIDYSVCRIKGLIDLPDITCKKRLLPYFPPGFGTYGWKYDYRIIEEAIKQKVALIDTAEGYGFGKTEEELGKALKEIDFDRSIVVATKVRRDHMSPVAMQAAAVRSVKKLGLVPHLQIHFPCDLYKDEVLGGNLVELKRKGIITSFGLGNCSVDMIESMQRFLSDYSGDVIKSVQVNYSLADRRIEECLLPYCQERGIVVIAYSPLGQNFKSMYRPILRDIGKKYEATSSQVALAWILRHRGVISIPRTNNLYHLRSNMDSYNLKLSNDDIDDLNSIYS